MTTTLKGWKKPVSGQSQDYEPQRMNWVLAKATEPLDHPTQKPPYLSISITVVILLKPFWVVFSVAQR